MRALNAIENITAVRLDVTKQDQIDAAVAMIEQKGTGLYALVNNAGIGGGGPVLETPVENQTHRGPSDRQTQNCVPRLQGCLGIQKIYFTQKLYFTKS